MSCVVKGRLPVKLRSRAVIHQWKRQKEAPLMDSNRAFDLILDRHTHHCPIVVASASLFGVLERAVSKVLRSCGFHAISRSAVNVNALFSSISSPFASTISGPRK